MSDTIPGLKLIRHNASRVNIADDPSFPFRLDAVLRPPEFMMVAFIGIVGGSEELTVRGMTREALQEFADRNGIPNHPRLIRWSITEPEKANVEGLKRRLKNEADWIP